MSSASASEPDRTAAPGDGAPADDPPLEMPYWRSATTRRISSGTRNRSGCRLELPPRAETSSAPVDDALYGARTR